MTPRSERPDVRTLWDHALQTLSDRFGFNDFRPGQRRIVRSVLTGRSVLGVLPTGGGKSLCYLLPAAVSTRPVVVVSPLIALIRDQVRAARGFGINAHGVHSQESGDTIRAVQRQLIRGTPGVYFLAPERLTSTGFKQLWVDCEPGLVVVDEAHCISSWGHDFRPSYRALRALNRHGCPILAVTATATPAVQDDIARSLGLADYDRVVTTFDRPNLHWAVHRLSPSAVLDVLVRVRWENDGAVIVYAATRKRVMGFRALLAERGIATRQYHAGEGPAQRADVEAWFIESHRPTLVATNAFGMGIDRPDVRAVVHVDPPPSLEALYQEAGRGGRDGEPALGLQLLVRSSSARRGVRGPPTDSLRTLRSALTTLRNSLDEFEDGMAEADVSEVLAREFGSDGEKLSVRLESLGWLRRLPNGRLWALRPPGASAELADVRQRCRQGRHALSRYLRTRSCRRKPLLAYFGESYTPSRCGRCDRCVAGRLEYGGWNPGAPDSRMGV